MALIAGLLGARLGFVALHFRLYAHITPWTRLLGSVFSPTPGTENGWAGLLVAVAVIVYLLAPLAGHPLALADSFAPGLAIMASHRLVNLLSGNWTGWKRLPWGIDLWGRRAIHPDLSGTRRGGGLWALWRLRKNGCRLAR